MKLWIDDVTPAPDGYVWKKSVNDAMDFIQQLEWYDRYITDVTLEIIDIDHDAGEYANEGGDYIKLLDWLEETGRIYPIHIHSMNPTGVESMRRIIKRNGWKEI